MNDTFTYIDNTPVAEREVDVRAQFIVRTYGHLFGAILAFTAIEFALFTTGAAESIARVLLSGSWLLVLGGFIVVSWIASKVAHTSRSLPAQYAALAGFVVHHACGVFDPSLNPLFSSNPVSLELVP